jgi:hypothetical protein
MDDEPLAEIVILRGYTGMPNRATALPSGRRSFKDNRFLPPARRANIATPSGNPTERRKLGSPDLLRHRLFDRFSPVLTLIGLRLIRTVRWHPEFER